MTLSHDDTGGERPFTPEMNDHELMRLIRKRVAQKPSIPMTQIAAELGTDVDTLCAFIMLYREPDNRAKEQRKNGRPPNKGWDIQAHEQRYAAWKKQHDGAAARLLISDAILDPVESMEKEAGLWKTGENAGPISSGKSDLPLSSVIIKARPNARVRS